MKGCPVSGSAARRPGRAHRPKGYRPTSRQVPTSSDSLLDGKDAVTSALHHPARVPRSQPVDRLVVAITFRQPASSGDPANAVDETMSANRTVAKRHCVNAGGEMPVRNSIIESKT